MQCITEECLLTFVTLTNLNIVICLPLVGDEWKSSFVLYRRMVEHTVSRQLVKVQLYVNDSVFEVDFGL